MTTTPLRCRRYALYFVMAILPRVLSAQEVAPDIQTKYSSSVVVKVYDLTGKLKLNKDAQQWYAKALSMNEKLVMEKVKNNEDASIVARFADSLQVNLENDFALYLGPESRSRFKTYMEETSYHSVYINGRYLSKTEMSSQFGSALKSISKLKLSNEQVDQILDKAFEYKERINYANAHPDSGFFNAAAFQSANMMAILSEKQYNDLLAEKNKESSMLQARYDWHEMQELGIAKKFNKDSTLSRLTVYYMLKSHITDCYAHEKEKGTLLLKSLRLPYQLALLRETKMGKNAKLAQYAW